MFLARSPMHSQHVVLYGFCIGKESHDIISCIIAIETTPVIMAGRRPFNKYSLRACVHLPPIWSLSAFWISSYIDATLHNRFRMKCIAFLSFLLLSIIALGNAMPGNDGHGHSPHPSCLNQGQANHLLQTWISFFVKMDPKVAGKTLDPNFQFYSDSSNFLEFYGPKAVRYSPLSRNQILCPCH